jgi:hypothetical protein
MIRKVISFCVASALFLGGLYYLIGLLFFSAGFYFWMPAAAGMIAFLGGYWLWEDFISPRFKKGG